MTRTLRALLAVLLVALCAPLAAPAVQAADDYVTQLSTGGSALKVAMRDLGGGVYAPAVLPFDGVNSPVYGVLQTNLTFTSPSSASTAAGTPVTGLGQYRSMSVTCTCRGATGGTLDIYIQMSPDGGTTWVDYAHFPQLAAGAAATTKVWTVSRGAQQTTLQTVGTGTSPALAANTIVGGDWGDRLRTVAVAGASTSAGAAQTILVTLTP